MAKFQTGGQAPFREENCAYLLTDTGSRRLYCVSPDVGKAALQSPCLPIKKRVQVDGHRGSPHFGSPYVFLGNFKFPITPEEVMPLCLLCPYLKSPETEG